jgi:hypothetical protein
MDGDAFVGGGERGRRSNGDVESIGAQVRIFEDVKGAVEIEGIEGWVDEEEDLDWCFYCHLGLDVQSIKSEIINTKDTRSEAVGDPWVVQTGTSSTKNHQI